MINCNIQNEILISAHISDLHFQAMDPKKQYTILEEQFLNKLEKMPRLDLICINGDLFDHKISLSSDATLYASMFIFKLIEVAKVHNATVIILQGTLSHDANQLKIYYHYMYRKDVDVRIVTNIRFEVVKNCRILCIPELYGISEEYYQNILFKSDFYDLCIMHGTIKGAVYDNNSGNSRLFSIEDFNNCRGPIIAGHVHKAATFYDHFYYCGSPYRWRFDDDCFKGFILLSYNVATRMYYIDYEEIISDIYKTITIDQLQCMDLPSIINCIDTLKKQGVNYIKLKFAAEVPSNIRLAFNNQFRGDGTISCDFTSQDDMTKRNLENRIEQPPELRFLLDNSLTDEQKFVMYVNHLKQNEKYLTVDELRQMLNTE